MTHRSLLIIVLILGCLLVCSSLPPQVKGCKDIVAMNDATAGDYNLLLKVRDPSREGLQVLCLVPKGYTYTYHRPWTGKPWIFNVTHTFLGVTTLGDNLPNIVKAGMALSDSGLAYGDADTGSNWINPTKNAWDDFDWLRYACEQASTEEEAVNLLTNEAVDCLHASAVSENLFVVGPTSAALIEADAYHSAVTPIHDVLVMSNYPKILWKTQLFKKLPLAASFDTTKEVWVTKGKIVRLNSLCGVHITDVGNSSIEVQPFPLFLFQDFMNGSQNITIQIGRQDLVGPYSVKLMDSNGQRAQISLSYMFKAWEEEIIRHITPSYGHITVETMMNLSRLHTTDMEGLRPMCEDQYPYEAAMIFKIPYDYSNFLSSGWFSANHACSSIYVPVHIADTDFFIPYKTGDAASLSLELLHLYGHGNLTEPFHNIEKVLLGENELAEGIARELLKQQQNISGFLTTIDTEMQNQAFLTEQLWFHLHNLSETPYYGHIKNILSRIWIDNYTNSLKQMNQAIFSLKVYPGSELFINLLEEIKNSISREQNTVNYFIQSSFNDTINNSKTIRLTVPTATFFDFQ